MAAKKQQRQAWKGFVSYRLTNDERDAFKEFDADCETPPTALLVTLFDQGFKVTIQADRDRESFTVACTGGDGSGDWAGYTHSSYAADVDTAIRLAYFKHIRLWPENQLPEQADSPQERFG